MTLQFAAFLSATVSIISTYLALSAASGGPPTELPWFRIILYPKMFGGSRFLVEFVLCLVTWAVVSVGFALVIAFIINSVLTSYGLNNARFSIGTFCITIIYYLALVRRVHSLTRKRHLLVKRHPYLSKPVSNTKRALALSVKLLLDYPATLLVPFYQFFYSSVGIFFVGLANYLREVYGSATVIAFYNYLRKTTTHPYFKHVEAVVQQMQPDRERSASVILTALLRFKGYYSTMHSLHCFIRTRATPPKRHKTYITSVKVNAFDAIGSVLDLWPAQDYMRHVPKTAVQTLRQSSIRIGNYLWATLERPSRFDTSRSTIFVEWHEEALGRTSDVDFQTYARNESYVLSSQPVMDKKTVTLISNITQRLPYPEPWWAERKLAA